MAARIVLEFSQVPEAKDLALLIALAEKFNAVVVEIPENFKAGKKPGKRKKPNGQLNASGAGPDRQSSSKDTKLPSLHLDFEKFPQNLEAFAVKPEQLDALAKIFEDEPSAEALEAQLRNLPIVFAQTPNALALAGIWENRYAISPQPRLENP